MLVGLVVELAVIPAITVSLMAVGAATPDPQGLLVAAVAAVRPQ